MNRHIVATLACLAVAAPGAALSQNGTPDLNAAPTGEIDPDRVVPLEVFDYAPLYEQGTSIASLMEFGAFSAQSAEEIGTIIDVLFDADNNAIAVVAEVGGIWDVGDIHVSVPWDLVRVDFDGQALVLPLTEPQLSESAVASRELGEETAGSEIVRDLDDAVLAPRMWRASDFIGDYARLFDGIGHDNFGWVSDLILIDGEAAAAVVTPDPTGFDGEAEHYAVPFYGFPADYDWDPLEEYYNLPYSAENARSLPGFSYEEMSSVSSAPGS